MSFIIISGDSDPVGEFDFGRESLVVVGVGFFWPPGKVIDSGRFEPF